MEFIIAFFLLSAFVAIALNTSRCACGHSVIALWPFSKKVNTLASIGEKFMTHQCRMCGQLIVTEDGYFSRYNKQTHQQLMQSFKALHKARKNASVFSEEDLISPTL